MLGAAALAALAVLPFARSAGAQTWVNPNTGSWSVAGNWVSSLVPVSGASTVVNFNASAAQSYTAFQNIAAPFTLNAINFGNSGTGLITVAGSSIAFGGTNPAVNQNGSGNATISNPLQLNSTLLLNGAGTGTVTLSGAMASSPPPTGTTGSSFVHNGASARSVITGGGTLYGLRSNTGSMFVQGGTWNLTSTQRGNDAFGGVSDSGFWSVVAGNTVGQTGSITFSNGALLNATNGFAANDAGESGVLTFTGSTTVGTFSNAEGRFGVNWGTGTVNVLAGAQVTARRVDIGRQAGSNGNLLIDGTNSRLTSNQSLDLAAEAGAVAVATISNGGRIEMPAGLVFMASATSALGDPLSSTAQMTITGTNSLVNIGGAGIAGAGQFAMAQGGVGVPAAGTLTISNGGQLNAFNTFLGQRDGVATVTISGAGASMANGNQFVMESTTASRLTISGGGAWTNLGRAFTSTNSGDNALITVSGTSSLADVQGEFLVLSGGGGTGVAAGNSTLSINSGGELRANILIGAGNVNGRADISVDGANSKLTISGANTQLILGDDDGALGTLTISNGGRATIASGGVAFVGASTTAFGAVNVTGPGSLFYAGDAATQLQVGGAGTLILGRGSFAVSGGASAAVGDQTFVFQNGTVNIGAGTSAGSFNTNTMAVNGRVNYDAGLFITTGTLSVAGRVQLSSAARLPDGSPTNKKTVQAGTLTLTGSGVVDLNDNDMIVKNGTRASIEARIASARNGGAWNGVGITSSAALNNPVDNTTLGVIDGSDYIAINGSVFNGITVAAGDKLVKYTFYGDSDFNGTVDFDDYVRIDQGYNLGLGGWFNGDFDLNGTVDFDDYVLIDLGYNTQSGTLGRVGEAFRLAGPDGVVPFEAIEGLTPAEKITFEHAQRMGSEYVNGFMSAAGLSSVPEPASTALVLGAAVVAAASRPRRPGSSATLRQRSSPGKPVHTDDLERTGNQGRRRGS